MNTLTKLSAALFSLAIVGTLSACSAGGSTAPEPAPQSSWPAENREAFTGECMRTSGGEQAYCECSLEHLEAQYTIAEFEDLEKRLVDDLSVMGELQQTIESCAATL